MATVEEMGQRFIELLDNMKIKPLREHFDRLDALVHHLETNINARITATVDSMVSRLVALEGLGNVPSRVNLIGTHKLVIDALKRITQLEGMPALVEATTNRLGALAVRIDQLEAGRTGGRGFVQVRNDTPKPMGPPPGVPLDPTTESIAKAVRERDERSERENENAELLENLNRLRDGLRDRLTKHGHDAPVTAEGIIDAVDKAFAGYKVNTRGRLTTIADQAAQITELRQELDRARSEHAAALSRQASTWEHARSEGALQVRRLVEDNTKLWEAIVKLEAARDAALKGCDRLGADLTGAQRSARELRDRVTDLEAQAQRRDDLAREQEARWGNAVKLEAEVAELRGTCSIDLDVAKEHLVHATTCIEAVRAWNRGSDGGVSEALDAYDKARAKAASPSLLDDEHEGCGTEGCSDPDCPA